jgi:uncharacterized protein YkwD
VNSFIKGITALVAIITVNLGGAHVALSVKPIHRLAPAAAAQPATPTFDPVGTDAYTWSHGHSNRPTVFPTPADIAPVAVPGTESPAASQPLAQLPIAAPRPVAPPPAPKPAPPAIVVGSTQQALINSDRANAGLGPLNWNSCLAGIAYQNALRMANQGYISHTNGPSLDLGCGLGNQAGENVGYWSAGINDYQLNTMFMNSPDHRANIMGPYHYVGTAWVVAKNGYAYIAVEFS